MDILTNEECCEVIGWTKSVSYRSNCRVWIAADGKFYKEPDFYNSLDACFKWLVPWIDEKNYSLFITRYSKKHCWVEIHNANGYVMASDKDKSPSIAFIKAFTQMVREG